MKGFVFLLFFWGPSLVWGVQNNLPFFCSNYESCRLQFYRLNASALEISSVRVPSRVDRNLWVDYAFYPATESPRNLVVMTSGVHGVEAFLGSAIQALWSKKVIPKWDRRHTGFLLIHSVNPFGFKYGRRVSENNVDLNRNFSNSPHLYKSSNLGYSKLNGILNPQGRVGKIFWDSIQFYASVFRALATQKMAVVREAILGGQYQFPKGIYYGGDRPQFQQRMIEEILDRTSKDYSKILMLDLHTGYGSRGRMHLFPGKMTDPKMILDRRFVFQGYEIENPEGDQFYTTEGDLPTFVTEISLAKRQRVVPMTLEFGTEDNQSYFGGMKSLHLMIRENQLYWHGSTTSEVAKKVKGAMRELYFPKSANWRNGVMAESFRSIRRFIRNFELLSEITEH
jgi:Protein of unknown function (DUF2817)